MRERTVTPSGKPTPGSIPGMPTKQEGPTVAILRRAASDCESMSAGAESSYPTGSSEIGIQTNTKNAQVAQLVEHGIEDPGVGGSIPSLGTIIRSIL